MSFEQPKHIQIKVRCPHCEKWVSAEFERFPRIRDFYTTNFQCTSCAKWIRLDFFVGNSHLNAIGFQSNKNS